MGVRVNHTIGEISLRKVRIRPFYMMHRASGTGLRKGYGPTNQPYKCGYKLERKRSRKLGKTSE